MNSTSSHAPTQELNELQRKFIHSFWFVVLMGALTAFDPLSIDMYLPAFPNIQAELKTTYSMVELSLSSFFIGMAFGQMVYGPLADRWGRKRPLLAGMSLYLLASLACGFATNIETLIALRILQAFGGCAGMVITRAIARDVFDSKKTAQFFSSMTLIFGLAPILAPSIGGWVITVFNWRWIFWLLGSANLIALLSIVFFLPETHLSHRSDISFKQALQNYARLIRDPWFVGYTIPDSFLRAGMFAYIAGSPFVFMELFHIEAQHYGWIFGGNAVGLVISSQINRHLLKKFTPGQILKTTRPFTLLAGICLFTLPFLTSSIWAVLLPLFLFIASLGFVGPNSTALALAHQGRQAGLASALFGTLQWTVAMFSSFMVSRLHNGTILPMTSVMLTCSLISVFGFWYLVGRREIQK
jgi:DHA1 family bicyclomycin/chloramphenicol resistance-like MFS transporter